MPSMCDGIFIAAQGRDPKNYLLATTSAGVGLVAVNALAGLAAGTAELVSATGAAVGVALTMAFCPDGAVVGVAAVAVDGAWVAGSAVCANAATEVNAKADPISESLSI